MEELTIEEKTKAYDEALERAKSAIKECGNNLGRIKMIESIFPDELGENKDEKIRKKLIEYFKGLMGGWFPYSNEEILAYLEKVKNFDEQLEQAYKNSDEVQYKRGYEDGYVEGMASAKQELEKQGEQSNNEGVEKEKNDYVSGQFLYCKGSFNEFKEGESYWLEYVGNDNYIGRSDNILNQKFHITPRQLYTWLDPRHAYNCNETNAPTEQGEKDSSVKPPTFTFDDVLALQCCMETVKKVQEDKDLYEKLKDIHGRVYDAYQLEKQGEQKSADKVEPNFKVGDWVVCEITGSVCQIKNCIENLSNHKYGYDLTNGGYIGSDEVNHYHLWTIQDVKKGDILARNDEIRSICIFSRFDGINKRDETFLCRCGLEGEGLGQQLSINGYHTDSKGYVPATREQRELLFREMEEAGYKWDDEKKELTHKEVTKKSDKVWNEEDEENYRNATTIISRQRINAHDAEMMSYCSRCIDWLSSIKERMR